MASPWRAFDPSWRASVRRAFGRAGFCPDPEHTNNATQKVALVSSTTDTLKKSRLRHKSTDKPGLVAFYEIRSGNGAGLFLQLRSPHGGAKYRDVLMRGSKEGTLLFRSRRRASSTSDRFQTPRRRSQRGAGDSMSRRFGRVRRRGRRLPSGTPRRLRPMFVYRVAITPRGVPG